VIREVGVQHYAVDQGFESDEYSSAVANSLDEARKLVEAGFEYVTDIDGSKLF